MMKTFQLVLLLGLISGLWIGADTSSSHQSQSNPHPYKHLKGRCSKKGACCEKCPDEWMEIDDRCYLFRSKPKLWCAAETACIKEGGNLASFHDSTELDAIKHVVEKVGNGVNVWLGGFDAVKEGSWKFTDGSRFNFKGFAPEIPNSPDTEDCMELKKGNVIDSVCGRKRAYVCSTNLKVKY